MLSIAFAAALVADAVLSWRDPEGGVASRLGASTLAAAALSAAMLFYVLDVVNFSADW